MFRKIAGFEFRYQLRNPVFWVASAVFFLLTFAATTVEQVRIGATGNVHKNAPYAIATVSGVMCIFAIFSLVAFVANVVVRDDDTGFGPIIRSTRIRKFDYLFGRYAGAFAAAALSFISVPLAIAVGSLMPWVDPDTLGPFVVSHYLYAYFVLALPTLLLTGAVFFALATLTRSMMGTYVGVVAFLVAYAASRIILSKPEYEHFGVFADPFGIAPFSLTTKYWTVTERNTALPALRGMILYNRMIWLGVAAAFMALAYRLFRFETMGIARPEKPARGTDTLPQSLPVGPRARPVFNPATARAQFAARTRIDMGAVFRSPAFFVLMALGVMNAAASLWLGDNFYGDPIYPVTRAMIGDLRGAFLITPILIAIYYAGELVWRDRDRRMHELIDSAPVPDWMFAVPKILALFLVLLATMLMSVATAIAVQTLKGFHTYEFGHYLVWYILPESITLLLIAILAIFVQAVSPVKYVGWGIMGLWLISEITLNNLGYEHNLYQITSSPDVPLSDMNGQGQFWIARAWFQAYWFVFMLVLAMLSHYLWRRGAETRFMPRLKRLPARLAGAGGGVMALLLVAFASLGGWIYYNTNVLNEYRTVRGDEKYKAEYEKTLLPFENTPQPRVTDVVLNVDLEPDRLRAHTTGIYTIENHTGQPISHIHLRWDRELHMPDPLVDGATVERRFDRFHYLIYTFASPMMPGERRHITFDSVLQQVGFRNSQGSTRVVQNGTFVDNTELTPTVGMDRNDLLADRTKRRKYGLTPELRMAKLEDNAARAHQPISKWSDWVNADITVSTSADQIPIAPGYTVSDTVANGRHTTRFKTDAPILQFFSIQSANYDVARDRAGNVDLAVYYAPQHPFNVQRILAAMKASLEVYDKEFSPYQFHQARILEFPAYATFAQSFANTVPYSEAIGFVVNVQAPDSVDVISYVTAHEMGHQWWGHQVMAANMQGNTMLVETFAQYSALLVMEKLEGPDRVRKFLKYELDRYLRTRGSEVIEELPLMRVEDQPYIHYQKGAVAMYLLKDQLGEDVVNRAMRRLIAAYAFKAAPYPTTLDFLAMLRQEAGPGHEPLISDLFEKITLYDVNVHSVHSTKRADGQYDVSIDVEAHKHYADGYGKETDAPLAENFDVGVFDRQPGKPGFGAADVISFTRMPIHDGRQILTLVASRTPAYAGVDPYNKRITRNSDTVLAKVE
jgi:ABC-2 type transport system permease protein